MPTRWNSAYYMLCRLLEQRKAVELHAARYKPKNFPILTDEQWTLAGKFTKLLQYFELASDEVCKDLSSIAVQLPIARILTAQLLKFDEPELKNATEKAIESINEKFIIKVVKEIQKFHIEKEPYVCLNLFMFNL